jgi:hypothetical protein
MDAGDAAGLIERFAAGDAFADVVLEEHAAGVGEGALEVGGHEGAEVVASSNVIDFGSSGSEQGLADTCGGGGFEGGIDGFRPDLVEMLFQFVHFCSPLFRN